MAQLPVSQPNQICILTRSPVIQMHMQVWEAIVTVGFRSPSATHLTNFWVSTFSPEKGGNTAFFKRLLWWFSESIYKKKLMWGLVYVGWSFIHSLTNSLLISYFLLSILPVPRHPLFKATPFKKKKKSYKKLREGECFIDDGKEGKYSSPVVTILSHGQQLSLQHSQIL